MFVIFQKKCKIIFFLKFFTSKILFHFLLCSVFIKHFFLSSSFLATLQKQPPKGVHPWINFFTIHISFASLSHYTTRQLTSKYNVQFFHPSSLTLMPTAGKLWWELAEIFRLYFLDFVLGRCRKNVFFWWCDKQEFNKIINHKSILGWLPAEPCVCISVESEMWDMKNACLRCNLSILFLSFFSLCFVCVAALMAILDICDWTPCRSSTCRWSLQHAFASKLKRNMNKKTNHVQWLSQQSFLMGNLHHLRLRAIWL